MRRIDAFPPSRAFRWILIIALAGLVVRLAASSGSLWLDEAWSAVLANDVGTPLGIFVRINHDNNHHLNSLWLQYVGLGAPPLVARGLSVVTGSLAIVLAGLIGARRGPLVGVITSLLFALSPALVSLGSEARGYAPMMLMTLIAVWYVDRFLAGDENADRPITLAICFFVGALFQLTMIFAACALVGWPLFVLWQRNGLRRALRETARLLGPATAALILAFALVFAPTFIGGAEFRFGAEQAFTISMFLRGVADLLGYAVGAPALSLWLLAGGAVLVILARSLQTPRLAFYWLAIIAFPLGVAALHTMNSGHPRYYLLAGLGVLLLLGEAISALVRAGGPRALAGTAVLLLFSGASMAADLELIQDKRGDPGDAVRAMQNRSPAGARVMIEREAALALLKVAGAEAHYPIDIAPACPARFYFADSFLGDSTKPLTIHRCNVPFRAIAAAAPRGMSGQNWTLYERLD